jgi:hypothetical protein
MARQYHLIIGIYSLLMILHLGTSFLLFATKMGWSLPSIQEFYLGNAQLNSLPKSTSGLLETAVPHLATVGIITFVLGHFLIFIPQISSSTKWTLGLSFPLAGLLNLASGFFIIYFGSAFIILKILSFVLFQAAYIAILWILIRAALVESKINNPRTSIKI